MNFDFVGYSFNELPAYYNNSCSKLDNCDILLWYRQILKCKIHMSVAW